MTVRVRIQTEDFNLTDEIAQLRAADARVGAVTFDSAGPRPAKFPRFATDNNAAKIAAGGSIRFADPGENSVLDFGLGDAITLEAWVAPAKLGHGQPHGSRP